MGKTINVEIEAFHGCDCGGGSYSSCDSKEYEITDEVYGCLKGIGGDVVTDKQVVEAINNGHSELQDLHDRICEDVFRLDEDYWLYEGDNPTEWDSLEESLEKDMEEGLFAPKLSCDEFIDNWKDGDIDTDDWYFECDEDWEDYDEEDFDEDAKDDLYHTYVLNLYRDWVFGHEDNAFVAMRVGVDLDACREMCSFEYSIS